VKSRNVLNGLMLTAVVSFVGTFLTANVFAGAKQQVIGTGASQAEATGEAHRNADQVCRNHRFLSEKCSQSGNTWTCVLMIECTD